MSSALFIIIFFLYLFRPCNTQTCSSNNTNKNPNPCPPFSSHPPFPFSSTSGCGHPSFQITCASPHSLISINNLSFSILSYNSNTSSITLSPHPLPTPHPNCPSFPSIPTRSINLSATPFRVSAATCSRLSFLRPCSPPSLPNCSHCPSQCHLIKTPSHLLPDCRSTHHSPQYSDSPCLTDILGYLQLSLKNGIQLDWDQSRDPYFTNCTVCRANNGTCGFNSSSQNKPFLCFRYRSQSTLTPPWIRKFKPNKMVFFSTVIAITSLLLLISVATAILRSARSKASSVATQQDPTTLFLHHHRSASLLPPVFTYDDLAAATHNFDPKRKIGDGGFGSVYLAQLRDGRLAAVKYLHRNHSSAAFSTKSFCNEILILSSIHHANLVKLHGYCSDPRGLLLVYDYIPNGTLAEHLHHRKGSLTWQVRLDIALQTALVMEYLHFSVVPPVVHRDITSSNIFVERDMRIKVGDFGLSRLLVVQDTTSSSNGFVWTGPQGTPGYLDPDYHRSFRLTEKSDVYSFGVVLLELISGKKAVDQSRDKREMALADLVVSRIQMGQLHQVLDPVFKLGDSDGVAAVAELAFRCVAADKDDRPDSREVVEELRRVRSRTAAAKE
ncbi:LEAF RUST 10 DISEASE-RESISTANCE LOCUS RECEPTOR-LIKE PROTEIN KINASE-like 1.5 [Vigna radiata var. radiata]|uniref:LEAF RUST 10 DISEASE-RESISTANCE LOCUS RECEPTOR-LIKE PROTEIN KINASE-like 1.5 n=1 Tax=Vigna radiata var. radiata TaxID=3916 RepID=A0A1S3VS67_VIGRR|nr:LEAF RUST 10 DISEASE-RESISTANCE LOCUS RECEPTOR-LIKE PROTEIN KINASE-like 1.5 [Vigna radiata var. radiata]